MRQATDHGVTRAAFTPTAATPLVRLEDPAGQHRTARIKPLAGHPDPRVKSITSTYSEG